MSLELDRRMELFKDTKHKELFTNKLHLLAFHGDLTEELQRRPNMYSLKPAKETILQKYCFVGFYDWNRVDLNDLMSDWTGPFYEKYILCRSITPSIKTNSLLMVVELPDADTKDRAVLLSLHNYTHPLDVEETSVPTISAGTILAIKNPLFYQAVYGYLVRSDNPGDVAVFDNSEFKRLFPKLKWPSGNLKSENFSLHNILWWKTKKNSKSIGLYRMQQNNYVGALEAFTAALNDNPRDVEALLHRCNLCLRFKMYEKSLEDCEMLLVLNPLNVEVICQKAVSLIGLRQYSIAIEYLILHMSGVRSSVFSKHMIRIKNLLVKAETFYQQEKYGIYDFVNMIRCPMRFFHECADHIGSVAESFIKGKGRGMIATKNIRCGELIIAAKAFAIAFSSKEVDNNDQLVYDFMEGEYMSTMGANLNASIAHRLLLDPNLSKSFYSLYDGTDRSTVKDTFGEKNSEFINMRRIHSICHYNAFGGHAEYAGHQNKGLSAGIWPTASLFNHSCLDSNSTWNVFGDFLFIRASKNISQGDEVTLRYINCAKSYTDRNSDLSWYGFLCNCSLCLKDKLDSSAVHTRRTEILRELDNLKYDKIPHCSQIETLIKELQDQRSDHPELNVYTIIPLLMLSKKYIQTGNYEMATDTALCVHAVASKTIMKVAVLDSCIVVVYCYLHRKMLDEAKIWVKTIKDVMNQIYGDSSEALLTFLSPIATAAMKEYGILFDLDNFSE